ncbi:alpha/beta fold hydrolase [Streptomyces sp. NPDC101150]|uniref:alpha/beta fold hydrolase n=1 Tax=Streptomyces sp. NPDC101150 TaxID=3366114 RepID=UPI00382D7CF7
MPAHTQHDRPYTADDVRSAPHDGWQLPDRVRVEGGEVATGVFGQGPPVVLVHGTPAWSYLWRKTVPRLAEHCTVYVWDLLGFGDSRPDPGVRPSIAQQAATLAELVAHWGLTDPVLVGHDIGGGIVLRSHLLHRTPARRLALLDSAVLGPWNTPFTEHQQRHVEAYRTMPRDVFTDLITTRFRSATHHPMPPEVAAAYLRPWAGAAGQQRWLDQVESVTFEDTREVVARLAEISVPTLVLWGERDQWLVPETARRLARAIPGARLETLPATGHFPAEDAPEETARALLRLLR